MLYKKYIRIKNVVDEELDRKYNKVKKAVGSNNKQIKQLKKDASELINTPNNDTNTLQEKINNNRDKIAENRVEMVDNNFQEINKVFKYESGFIVGGNAGQLRIGSDNIKLNVPNPVQVRVCDEQSCDSDIFTKRNTEDSIPVVINENVDSGVDESKNGDDPVVVTSDDGNLEFNNDTKELSATTNIVGYKLENIYNYTDKSGIPLLKEGDYLGFFEKNGVIAIINTFSSDSIIKINSRVLDESYEIILDSQGKVTAIINTKVSD
jgi:hypothetical protein